MSERQDDIFAAAMEQMSSFAQRVETIKAAWPRIETALYAWCVYVTATIHRQDERAREWYARTLPTLTPTHRRLIRLRQFVRPWLWRRYWQARRKRRQYRSKS